MSHRLPDEPTFQQLLAQSKRNPSPSTPPLSPTSVGGATTTTLSTVDALSPTSSSHPRHGVSLKTDLPPSTSPLSSPQYVLSPRAKAALSAIPSKIKSTSSSLNSPSLRSSTASTTILPLATSPPNPSTATPPQPEWLLRPFLRGIYTIQPSSPSPTPPPSLLHLSPTDQEKTLVEEALYALMGIESDHIRAFPSRSGMVFQVSNETDADPSIVDLLNRILPLANAYARVVAWVESSSRYESGLVAQALAAAVRELLNEYLIVIAQLEHQIDSPAGLNLQKLWFYIQPSMSTLSALGSLAKSVAETRASGGVLLSLLHDAAIVSAGDSPKRALMDHLLAAAAVPYFDMLTQWVTSGAFTDPYGEFMVVDSSDSKAPLLGLNDSYWSDKYALRPRAHLPRFLEDLAPTILTTGKYLNVVAGCGIPIEHASLLPGNTSAIVYSPSANEYVKALQAAHAAAAALVINVLFKKYALMERLLSFKRYFLLGQGDVLPHFFEIAGDELTQASSTIDTERLQALLELAMRSTSARDDPHKDEIGFAFVPLSIPAQVSHINAAASSTTPPESHKPSESLSGFEAFAFDFHVQWPLNLVLTTAAITKYQLLNRHLILTQRVSSALSGAWKTHKLTKAADVQAYFKRAFALRSKMLHFVSSYLNYMFYQVLDPAWVSLSDSLSTADSLDAVVNAHEAFLNSSLKECLLTHPGLLKLLSKLLSVCSIFSQYVSFMSDRLSRDGTSVFVTPPFASSSRDPDLAAAQRLAARRDNAASAIDATSVVLDAKDRVSLSKFEANFGDHIRLFLQTINNLSGSEKHLAALFSHLDFTGHYSEALGLFSY